MEDDMSSVCLNVFDCILQTTIQCHRWDFKLPGIGNFMTLSVNDNFVPCNRLPTNDFLPFML